jgi:hypothetical protein
MLLFVIVVLLCILFIQNKKAFAALLVFIAVLLISFSASKTLEGSTWVFMSSGRMYLGIPLLISLLTPLIKINLPRWLLPVLVIPILFTIIKLSNLDKNLDWNYERKHWIGVRLIPLREAISLAEGYKKACETYQTNFLLVSSYFWMNSVVSAAGPAIFEDYPETQETHFEKRYWVREKNENRIVEKFILLAGATILEPCMPSNKNFKLKRLDDYGLYLITENKRSIKEFMILLRGCEPRY